MKNRIISAILIGALAITLLAGGALAGTDHIKIGGLFALTGWFDSYDVAGSKGFELAVEEINALIGRLGVCSDLFPSLLYRLEELSQKDLYHLVWARGLVNAAAQINDWQDVDYSMTLCRTFIHVEKQYLNCYYSPTMLSEKNIFALASQFLL